VRSEGKKGTVSVAGPATSSICVTPSTRVRQYYNPLREQPLLNLQQEQYNNFIYIYMTVSAAF